MSAAVDAVKAAFEASQTAGDAGLPGIASDVSNAANLCLQALSTLLNNGSQSEATKITQQAEAAGNVSYSNIDSGPPTHISLLNILTPSLPAKRWHSILRIWN